MRNLWRCNCVLCGIDEIKRIYQIYGDTDTVITRPPAAACAQIADHLDKNCRKTATMAEVVCVLGGSPVKAILTRTQHRLPTPSHRPTAHMRIGYEHADRL